MQHGRHGAGLRHRDGADRRRGARHRRRGRQGRASRHRRDALRHGRRSARARPSTWATRCGSRPRTPAPSCGAGARGRPAGGHATIRSAEMFRKRYGMQAGNIVGTGTYIPSYRSPDPRRAVRQHHAVLDGRRRRRRDRGRHRDRACPGRRSWSTSPTAATRSIRAIARDAALRRGDHAARLHAVREAWSSTPARSPTPRSPTTRFPACTTSRRCENEAGRGRRRTAGRSAPRASARSGTFGVSPAIANAIEDAVGVRLTELP